MDNQPVIKAAIQSAVSKGIRDIRRDPNRSIRKLVDLGMQFGKGRNQKSFFTDAQSVLKNSNSVYYALVTSLIRNVDPQTLETFGINIGYMSWTMGAKMIRAYEKERGVNVPWAILLRCNMPAAKPLDLSRLVAEGQALGIFAYFLFVGSQTERLADMLATVAQCHTCAFFPDGGGRRDQRPAGRAGYGAAKRHVSAKGRRSGIPRYGGYALPQKKNFQP